MFSMQPTKDLKNAIIDFRICFSPILILRPL